ncbi:trimethylamine methyltransferase family protein [Cypionkella sp. TWP1-2-1b2]|uniref:trimethylamine methyltransferase family protein n=1 Tax=Cypionkella sp. TWP1-2-1b2 TaxID=2804675 RepID=UPI003CEE4073
MRQNSIQVIRTALTDAAALSFDAIAEVQPGGHFFSVAHRMKRYQTAFYRPLVVDLSNHGAWTEAVALTADQRATAIWKQRLADFTPQVACDAWQIGLTGSCNLAVNPVVRRPKIEGLAADRRLRRSDFVYRSEYIVITVHRDGYPQR